jgi:NADPH:quinone reductase-like Zn-dependent oxidoreductase
LPGWWLSTESFREWGPLVPVERWNQLLQENQFTGTELIIDGVDKSTTLSSAMISTAYEHRPDDEDIFSNSSLVVVRSEASALQHSLALSIQGAGKTFGLQVNITDADGFRDIGAPCVFLQTMNQFSFRCPREKEFDDLKKVFRNAKNLLWVTRRDSSSAGTLEQDAILGLSRSIISENEGLKIVTLGLEDVEDGQRATRHIWTVLHKYFKATCASPMHTHGEEIAEIDGLLCVSRLLPARKLEADIRMIQYQDKSLAFEQDTADNCIIDDGEIEIEVKAIGLRPQTLSRILGQATTSLFANDYAGVVTQVGQSARSLFQVGAGVIAVTHNHDRTFKARVQTPAYLVHKIPDGLNFAEAVAMPLDFMTAYDALTNWARLQTGESILIQDGCGALGQAAIQVALLAGAIIFVTVAKDEDVEFISALYKIPISHVLRHHRGDIAADMKQLSGGRGVNVVFNPLTSNGHYTSWESVAPYGRVIEVGDQDMYASSGGSLPVPQSLKKNIMFARVDLAELFQNRARVTTLLSIAMDMIESKKIVAPEPLHVYTASQIANAFRKEDSGMSSGKIVLSYDPRNDASSLTTPKLLPFHPNATYIITGGLGGLGKSIAKWMVTRGARNLLLLSRQGGETSAAEPFLNKLTASGVEVFAPKCDIGDEKAVNEVFREVQKCMPPIKGCIQASMVLKVR